MLAGDRLAAAKADHAATALLRFLPDGVVIVEAFRQSFSGTGQPFYEFAV
jgi:hypothetical protein